MIYKSQLTSKSWRFSSINPDILVDAYRNRCLRSARDARRFSRLGSQTSKTVIRRVVDAKLRTLVELWATFEAVFLEYLWCNGNISRKKPQPRVNQDRCKNDCISTTRILRLPRKDGETRIGRRATLRSSLDPRERIRLGKKSFRMEKRWKASRRESSGRV